MVVDILPLARARLSSKRTDRMDTAAHCWGGNYPYARLAVGPELKISAWNFADACSCRALGNPSANSNSRSILRDWNRTACHWPLAWHDGRSRSEFVWDVSVTAAVLFCDRFRQFFPMVDQVATVDGQIVETKGGRD